MLKSALIGVLVAICLIAAFLTVGCATFFGAAVCAIDRTPRSVSQTVKSEARKAAYLKDGVPTAYRGRRNPLRATIGNVIEGARLYDLRCAICHGMMGVGDGEAGEKLDHPPADLGESLADASHRDDYFYWTIAVGGTPYGTDMPPFRHDLSDGEIWKVITFMRAAFADGNRPLLPPARRTDRRRVIVSVLREWRA